MKQIKILPAPLFICLICVFLLGMLIMNEINTALKLNQIGPVCTPSHTIYIDSVDIAEYYIRHARVDENCDTTFTFCSGGSEAMPDQIGYIENYISRGYAILHIRKHGMLDLLDRNEALPNNIQHFNKWKGNGK